jgi:hypothetical protein
VHVVGPITLDNKFNCFPRDISVRTVVHSGLNFCVYQSTAKKHVLPSLVHGVCGDLPATDSEHYHGNMPTEHG